MEHDARAWAVHRHVVDATPEELGLHDSWDTEALWELLLTGDGATTGAPTSPPRLLRADLA